MRKKRKVNQDQKNEDSKLRSRGIITLKQWCEKNGYNGVTQECIVSASQQEDPKLKKMANTHLQSGIVKKIKGETIE